MARVIPPAILFALVAVLMTAGAAFGQSPESGFYVGARAGAASMETPTVRDREGPGLRGYDRRDVTWSVHGGHEWRVAPRLTLGVEGGYSDHGTATITYASANAYGFSSTGWDLLGSAALVGRRLTLGLKAGVSRTREQYRLSTYVSGVPDLDSERTRDLPVVAAVVGIAVTARLSVGLDLRRTFGDVADTVTKALIPSNPTPPPFRDVLNSVSRVTAVSMGVKVRF
jgi:hypothetical protein